MTAWQQQTHCGVQTLTPYEPGKSATDLLRERDIANAIKLASNENPFGCSQAVRVALNDLPTEHITTYANAYHHPLKTDIAHKLGLSANQVVLANGSDSLFTLLFTLFCLNQNKHVLTHKHCFPSYPIQAQSLGIPIKRVDIDEHWHCSVSALIQACDQNTGVLIFANPNNPTGTMIQKNDIECLLENISKSVVVVVDEAYFEFAFANAEDSALPLLQKYDNLVITRSFSKAYGLAGMRLGYALANESIIELLWRIQQPFAVNGLALHCGQVAWQDNQFVEKTVSHNLKERKRVTSALLQLGYQPLPSHTNFVTLNVAEKAPALNEYLLNQGIIVRPLASSDMASYLRISIGLSQQSDCLLEAIKNFSDL